MQNGRDVDARRQVVVIWRLVIERIVHGGIQG